LIRRLMTKAQLQQCNNILDKKCQDLYYAYENVKSNVTGYKNEIEELEQETTTLKSVISLLMTTSECYSKVIKLQTPKPMHIRIDDDYCIITMKEFDENRGD